MQINKAKTICDCLIASEGTDLKLQEAFCLFLLGEVCFSVPTTNSYSADIKNIRMFVLVLEAMNFILSVFPFETSVEYFGYIMVSRLLWPRWLKSFSSLN